MTTEKDFLQFVAGILRVPAESLSPDSAYESIPEWDSVTHLRLALEIEARYGVEVPVDEVAGIRTLRQFYGYVGGEGADCVVVTGSESGIGAAVVAELRARGEAVFGVDLKGGDLSLDLTSAGAAETLGAAVKAKYRSVKGFVHCAGFDSFAPLGLVNPDTARRLYDIHAGFPVQFLGWLRKKSNHAPGASCVLVSSLAAREGAQAHVAYAAAKGAVEGLLRPAAAELAAKGIRLNAVVLGIVETAMSRAWLEKLPPDRLEAVRAGYPLGFGRPESVAKAIAFLLGDGASWITGQTLVCDGGHLLRE